MSNIFNTVETLIVPRCYLHNSQDLRSTMNFGKITPVFCKRLIPGETVAIYHASLIKCQPMSAPSMTPMSLYLHTFFVPFRLLDANFERGYTGSTEKGVAYDYDFPIWEPDSDDLKVGSLWDYFGLPLNVTASGGVCTLATTNVKGVEPTIYLKRAYNLIYNNWYRNENLIDEVDLDSGDIQYRCWKKDYFTSALPFREKPAWVDDGQGNLSPNPVYSFPVNTMVSGVGMSNLVLDHDDSLKELFIHSNTGSGTNTGSYNVYTTNLHWKPTSQQQQPISTDDKLVVDVADIASRLTATSTSFDVSDLRFAVQMQKWAERNARAGSRFTEYLRARFAVAPLDARLQIPEFVGGTKQPIIVSDVIQTSMTSGSEALGTRGATGTSVGSDYIGKYHCEEPGFIITLASILPKAEYMQGVNRQFIIHDRMDFVSPEFCCLSERDIKQGELCVSTSNDDETAMAYNTKNFGYTGMYNEFRFLPNITTGLMRTKFAYWHMTRVLDNSVALNQDFVECHADNRPFVVQNEDPFMLMMKTDIKDFLPITHHATPGLVDHF